MSRIRVLFMAYADQDIFCAQDLNGREVALRLDPSRFKSYLFLRKSNPDPRLVAANHVHLIRLPQIRKVRGLYILKTMLFGEFDAIVSGKVERLDILYLGMRRLCSNRKIHFHTVENLRPAPSGKIFDAMAKFIALNSDYTFAISRKISDMSKAWCGRHFDLMYAVGIDASVFYPSSLSQETKRVIGCGSLSQRKQPDLFVDIARRFPDNHFTWIGNGEMKQALQRKITRERISNVNLLEPMPQERLAKEFRQSAVFLFPSTHEGFPKVVIEAMACGLPAIVFDHYGPEAVIDEVSGFVVHTRQKMEERLQQLLQSEQLRNRMSVAAVNRSKSFSWEIIAGNYERILISLGQRNNGD